METTNTTSPLAVNTPAQKQRLTRLAVIAGVLLVACVLPFLVSNYHVFQFTQVYVYGIALLGLNLLIGFNGQFSLGHGAFFAVGAYTSAIMIDQWDIAYGWTIPAAGIVCGIVGFLFGIPALRIHGHYLALATLALALAMPPLLKYHVWEDYTGGVQGILVDKPSAPWGLPLNPDQWLYYLSLFCLVVAVAVAFNLLNSRTGRAMMAIRDHHIAAESMGINTALYKSITFGVSALYTGVSGALSCIVIQFVAPDSFDVFLSIRLLVGSVVGGLASITGAIFGSLFFVFIPNLADVISKAAPWAIYGLFLIGFMLVMPAGIAGTLKIGWARLQARLRAQAATRPGAGPAGSSNPQ